MMRQFLGHLSSYGNISKFPMTAVSESKSFGSFCTFCKLNRAKKSNSINQSASYCNTVPVEDEPKRTPRLGAGKKEDWQIIYRFKHIVSARAIQKMKVYQTAASCLIITPMAGSLYFYDVIDVPALQFVLGGSAFACAMLYVMGNMFGRLVGIIYSSKSQPDKVKIARLNFWGDRLDEIHPIDDFLPFSDLAFNPKDIYFKLKQYSREDDNLYLSLSYGIIYNSEEFERVFGSLPQDCNVMIAAPEKPK